MLATIANISFHCILEVIIRYFKMLCADYPPVNPINHLIAAFGVTIVAVEVASQPHPLF